MTDRERAKALADEIDQELADLRSKFAGRGKDHFFFGLVFASWEVILDALRAYSNPVVHADPDLETGEYVVRIETKGGAVQINGPVSPLCPTTGEMVDRLKSAIEGECGGLAISDEQARAILEYAIANQGNDEPKQGNVAPPLPRSEVRESEGASNG